MKHGKCRISLAFIGIELCVVLALLFTYQRKPSPDQVPRGQMAPSVLTGTAQGFNAPKGGSKHPAAGIATPTNEPRSLFLPQSRAWKCSRFLGSDFTVQPVLAELLDLPEESIGELNALFHDIFQKIQDHELTIVKLIETAEGESFYEIPAYPGNARAIIDDALPQNDSNDRCREVSSAPGSADGKSLDEREFRQTGWLGGSGTLPRWGILLCYRAPQWVQGELH